MKHEQRNDNKGKKESEKKKSEDSFYETCTVNNSVCNTGDDCRTGLVDKTGVI